VATAYRLLFGEGIDWTIFARMAVDRGVASLAAHWLVCVASDMVPQDILGALREIVHQTRIENSEILAKIGGVLEEIPSQGPRLATENALAAASKALTDNPTDVAAWRKFGRTLLDVHRHQEAIACYVRATALAPDYAANWIDRARAMSAAGRRVAALPYIDKHWRSIRKTRKLGQGARTSFQTYSVLRKPQRRAIAPLPSIPRISPRRASESMPCYLSATGAGAKPSNTELVMV